MFLGGQAGGGTGEADDLRQFLFREIGRGFFVLQELAHGAAAENIARAGGINYPNAGWAADRCMMGCVGNVATLGAQGGIYQRHAVFGQELFLLLLFAGGAAESVAHLPGARGAGDRRVAGRRPNLD